MTAAEYLALPEEKPYLEYVDGVVLQKPMANAAHGRIVRRLDARFDQYIERHGGDAGPERRVAFGGHFLLPDAAYWAVGRPSGDDSLPSVAVEVRSPGQTMAELREKCRAFRRSGVPTCWLIDPERRSVELFEGDRDGVELAAGGTLVSVEMPEFALPLPELFAVLES